ncbi:ATP-dependent sacrificial sulfur transferase LarE [Methanobrevibacter woesei]|uniref:ATP-dependent sacrificial sulfur transferase LarE n=1 Tax=Methanobrevibacter woesei TaxID=190976 RepID=UPI0039F61A72
MKLQEKISNVKNLIKDKKIAISFSGGADSTLIAYLAAQVSDNPIAITVDNKIMPEGFVENAKEIAGEFGLKHIIIDIDFFKSDIILNNPNRCFLCRKSMYEEIKKVASKNNCEFIVDGTNSSDLIQDRPGILINYENNIQSPFVKAQLTSEEIHKYLDENNIRYSKSTTCMATRLPFKTEVTKEEISKIDSYEKFIKEVSGCDVVKVRKYYDSYVCEVDDLDKITGTNTLKQIYDKLNERSNNKVLLNLSSIKDNERIILEYNEGAFQYKLPYNINIENTKKELEKDNINTKLEIKKNGIVKGNNFNSYNQAINEFIKLLPYIRRTI